MTLDAVNAVLRDADLSDTPTWVQPTGMISVKPIPGLRHEIRAALVAAGFTLTEVGLRFEIAPTH